MYGGYSVAGLTRQFVALKTVSSNLTTHPTEYVLHFAERIFFMPVKNLTHRIVIVGATLGRPLFLSPIFCIRRHAPKRTAYPTKRKRAAAVKLPPRSRGYIFYKAKFLLSAAKTAPAIWNEPSSRAETASAVTKAALLSNAPSAMPSAPL